MTESKPKKVFIDGPITPDFVAKSIASHATKKGIGAHSIFLGQVRNDIIDGKSVVAIDYTAYAEMADQTFHEIREAAFAAYPLTCLHIYHSLGTVLAGEISLFVFTSAIHRAEAIKACEYIVERIKHEAPVWGKEILEDGTSVWKVNTL
jgi:molybdopterin synthase catalytic subunit